jgi:hypothetical protein
VTSIAQSKAEASSQIFHFDKFITTIFLLSIAHLKEKLFFG